MTRGRSLGARWRPRTASAPEKLRAPAAALLRRRVSMSVPRRRGAGLREAADRRGERDQSARPAPRGGAHGDDGLEDETAGSRREERPPAEVPRPAGPVELVALGAVEEIVPARPFLDRRSDRQ